MLSTQPDLARRLWSQDFSAALADQVRQQLFDFVHVEGLELAPYLFELARSLPPTGGPRLLFDAHNAEHLIQHRAFLNDRRLPAHKHDHEDQLFLVLKGRLKIECEDREPVEIAQGEFFIVPKGLLHNPIAERECQVTLIEQKSTKHTGDVITERTRSIEDQLRGT